MQSSNKLHLGVYGVITDNNRILLVRKSRGPYEGKLDLPGGKIEHGEEFVQALSREVLEETGLVFESAQLLMNLFTQVDFVDGDEMVNMHHIGLIYRVHGFNPEKVNTQIVHEDARGIAWVEIKSVAQEDVSPFVFEVISKLRQS